MIVLPPPWMEEVRTILRERLPAGFRVVAFGSRVTGQRVKSHSDLDLCILGAEPLSDRALVGLRDAFEVSRLPIRVDVVDGAALAPSFRAIVDAAHEEIDLTSGGQEKKEQPLV